MNNDYNIQLGVKADGSDLQKQVDRLAKGLKDIDIKVDSSSLKNVSVTYEEIEKTGKRIQTINAQLVNQNGQLLSATIKVDDATGDIINKKTKWTQSTKTETAELNKQTQQIQKQASLITQMNKADTKLKLFDMDYGNIEQFGSKIKSLQSELNSVQGIKNIDDQSSAFAKVNNEIQLLNKSLSIYKKNANLDDVTKRNQKLADSMDIVKTRSDGANKGFSAYLKTLKPQALKEYSAEIKGISDAFSKAQDTGNKMDYSKASASLSKFKSEMKNAGMETASFSQILKDNISAFTNWYLIGNAVSLVARNFRSAIGTIVEVDTLLTEISKTSNLTGESLKELGINAFDAASKYGTAVQAYLKGFQEMSRGNDVETATGLAELSIMAQSAGDMTAELANDYIIATNAAYKLNNEVSKLTNVLDGQNQITNRNQVSMTDLAEATKVAGSQAAQSGIAIDEMTAAMGTMIASTKQGGAVAGRAFKGILMNLQQVSGEIDGEVFNEESFKKVEETLNNVGVKIEKIVDGTARLRNPIEILKELAEVYNSLPDDSVNKANIISDLGGKYRGNEYYKMLTASYVQKCA
jgi:TP901 family phage tail tape measure protein